MDLPNEMNFHVYGPIRIGIMTSLATGSVYSVINKSNDCKSSRCSRRIEKTAQATQLLPEERLLCPRGKASRSRLQEMVETVADLLLMEPKVVVPDLILSPVGIYQAKQTN